MAPGAVKLQGVGGNSQPAPRSANTRPEVNVRMIRQIRDQLLEVGGPASHWIRPETLVDLTIEGRNVNALADSGSQVNMITPVLVQQYGFPVLPLEDLVDYLLNLVGLGRKCTSPLSFWLIWYSTKRAYVIMICPSCIVVMRHQRRHHPASASASSASVHSLPSHRIQDRNFIFSMNMHMCPQYMHIKYLVILTCSF